MSLSAAHRRYTFAEYIQLESYANVKHEFFAGEIYAMAGGSPEHASLSVNVSTSLAAQLRGKSCRVHSSDRRVRVGATGLTTYPDVTVVCGDLVVDPANASTVVNPIVVVEVLSPSTEEYDPGDKFEHYKLVASLREVVLVSHRERSIEVFRREPDDRWSRTEARAGSRARLASIACELDVDDVYRDPLTGGFLVS
jgi:Uma2 family endonuclease